MWDLSGVLAPHPGIRPIPLALEGEVLTTGPLGKFLELSFCVWSRLSGFGVEMSGEVFALRPGCLGKSTHRSMGNQQGGSCFQLKSCGNLAHTPLSLLPHRHPLHAALLAASIVLKALAALTGGHCVPHSCQRVPFKSSFSWSGNGSACTSRLHHVILGLPCGAVQKQTCPHSHTAGGPTWPLRCLPYAGSYLA